MDLRIWYEVILPLLEVLGTALICITTPQERFNFFSDVLALRNAKGQPLLRQLRISQSCKACSNAGTASTCMHPAANRPQWKPDQHLNKVSALYGANRGHFEREIMGMISSDDNAVFRPEKLDRWFKKRQPYIEPHEFIDTVYMCFDPNGGFSADSASSAGSAAAIVSCFLQAGNMVVSTRMLSASSISSARLLMRASVGGSSADSMRSASPCFSTAPCNRPAATM